MPPAVIIGSTIAAGAIAGSMSKKSSASEVSGINLADPSALENKANASIGTSFDQLTGLTNAGPGQQDVTAATGASRSFADMLKQMSETGGLPGQEDITAAGGVAQNLFQPQRVAQQQAFQDAMTQSNQQAAILGRAQNDPILAAKLQQENLRQRAMLEANQGATQQQLALQLPGQRAQYAGQAADVLGGLATQAFRNRAALLEAGSNIQSQERQFRLATGERYGRSNTESGGGLGGAITGAIGGAGAGASIASGMGGMFGAGGGAGMTSGGFGSQASFGGGQLVAGSPAQLGSNFQGPQGPLAPGFGAYGSQAFGMNRINLGGR
jgi:hypothetical protein